MTFQLVDDILDYFGEEKVIGKPVGGDFREGKMTMPLIIGLSRCDESESAMIRERFGRADIDKEELKPVIDILIKYGAWDFMRKAAHRFAEEAKDSLKGFEDRVERQILENLATAIVYRNL